MEQTPSVGRIVHYVSHGSPVLDDGTQTYTSQCRAAVITEVWFSDPELTEPAGIVSLCVLNPTGQFFNEHIEPDENGHAGGTWHWPERTEQPNITVKVEAGTPAFDEAVSAALRRINARGGLT